MIKKYFLIILIFCALIFAACFSPWKGDEGSVSIIIGFGNEKTGNRSVEEYDTNQLIHIIELTGDSSQKPITRGDVKYGKPEKFSVTPGFWKISVTAFLNNKEYAKGSEDFVIVPGPNEVYIPIKLLSDIKITFEQIAGSEPIIKEINEIIFDDNYKVIIEIDDPEQYSSIEWRKNGVTGYGGFFILHKFDDFTCDEEYEAKRVLNIMVEVVKGGKHYSQTIYIEYYETESGGDD